MIEDSHSCYLGDRTHRHDWGYGCGTCPACQLRADGFANFMSRRDVMMTTKAQTHRGHRFPRAVLPDHSGGELDDRQCRHGLRAQRAVPYAGRARHHGAVGRADGRRRSGAARSGAAAARRRIRRRRDRRRRRAVGLAWRRRRWCLPRRVAFLLSEFADFAVYTPLARRRLVAAVVASSIVGLVVDSIVFLWLAFGSLEFLFGQIVGKVWMVLLSIPFVAVSAPPRRAAWPEPCVRIVMASALEILRNVTTGTITTMLLKKGIRHSWMAGAMPFGFSGKRVVGPAFTLRFVPVREDLATPESWSKPISTRGAIEAMPEGCVVVADAMGVTGAGIFGDILCMRMVKRGVTALVTDGVMRDKHGVLATGLPVWCAGVAAPASVNRLTFVGWNEPIGCGGCAIFPGRHDRRR